MKIIPYAFLLIFLIISAAFSQTLPLDSAHLAKEKLVMSCDEGSSAPLKVYKLCQGGRELHIFPSEILQFTNLHELNISMNFIESLPDSITKLKYLTELNISTNNLKTLPNSFTELERLKTLDLSNNPQLDFAPVFQVLSKMKSLETLDLSYNNLKEIGIIKAIPKSLKVLHIEGNEFSADEINQITEKLHGIDVRF
jgi:hypothetical protein